MPTQVPDSAEDGREDIPEITSQPSSGRGSPIDSADKMLMLRTMREQLITNRNTIADKDYQLQETRVALEEANLQNNTLMKQNKQLEKTATVTREMCQLGKQMAQLKDLEVKSLKLEVRGLMAKIQMITNRNTQDEIIDGTTPSEIIGKKNEEKIDQSFFIEIDQLKEQNAKQKQIIEKMEKDCLHPLRSDDKLAEKIFVLSNLYSELEKKDNELSFLELVGERILSLLSTGKQEEEESLKAQMPLTLHNCFKVYRRGDNNVVTADATKALLYIKDLLLVQRKLEEEVKSLKEVSNQLNLTVLEQEKELSSMSMELTSAWGQINKVKNQHGILHNAREAHRHDLREKRKLLTKLKEELEFSHQKLLALRTMNKDSQAEWQSMRDERDSRRLSGSEVVEEVVAIAEEAVHVEESVPTKEQEVLEELSPILSPEDSRVPSPTESEALPSSDEIIEAEERRVLEKEERLKLLEDQCKFLYARLLRSTHRSILLAERLSALHDQYGSNDEAGTPKAAASSPEPVQNGTEPVQNGTEPVQNGTEPVQNGTGKPEANK